MRRRALLSASVLSLAGLSGCLGDVRRRVSGRVTASHATAVMHSADDPWIRGGLSADSDRAFHAELFTEAPDDVYEVFTDDYPRKPRSFDNDVRNDDYSAGFSLLAEAKMPRAEAYTVLPGGDGEEGWAEWDSVSLPLRRRPYGDGAGLPDHLRDADELLCTMLARYEAESSPSTATVTVYDEERGGVVRETTARPWSRS
ncbi:hypothetical protein NDI76_08905 [Halogeometricum sp. S1BR25-6]|uniref:DUF8130 domain-containing protein n=1 Tax=Halogeometricum salsisoli TaxID=2950536 RepID=A0ABU2GDI9_9EURY|nr:hypothetical protein [Halogeometricum sp. S1BR25-6]MDS0298862.1 hypothetical protein [Halogeometricum sp. S1BR25-6]